MIRQTRRPTGWLGHTPWRPDPAPLYVVLDATRGPDDPPGRVPARVRFASFDRETSDEVRTDWEAAGHDVFIETLEGGLDAVHGGY